MPENWNAGFCRMSMVFAMSGEKITEHETLARSSTGMLTEKAKFRPATMALSLSFCYEESWKYGVLDTVLTIILNSAYPR